MATRKMLNFTTAIAAALLVAGCGSKSETELASGTYTDPDTGKTADYKVSSGDGGENTNVQIKTEDGEMSFGSGAAHAKLPAGFSPYPGSKMTGGFAASGTDGIGGMATFEAKAKTADVIAHFRKQAEAAGMKITTEVNSGDTMMLVAEKPGDDKSGVQITASQSADMVTGAVTYGHGG